MLNEIEAAQTRWLNASESASQIASELFQPGSGYGDFEARNQAEHRLQSARHEAARLFQEYHDLDRREMELDRREMEAKMHELQKSQRLATWASFAVAAVVGLTTVVSTLVALFK
jgi:hypothetical protein